VAESLREDLGTRGFAQLVGAFDVCRPEKMKGKIPFPLPQITKTSKYHKHIDKNSFMVYNGNCEIAEYSAIEPKGRKNL